MYRDITLIMENQVERKLEVKRTTGLYKSSTNIMSKRPCRRISWLIKRYPGAGLGQPGSFNFNDWRAANGCSNSGLFVALFVTTCSGGRAHQS